MGIGHDEPHAAEAPRAQRTQEGRPEGAVLGVAHVEPEDLALAGGGHPGGHHDGLRHDPRPVMGLDVRGVEEEVGEADMVERPLAEAGDDRVELAADAADLALGHARLDAQGHDQVVDLARRHTVDVGLHDDRPEGLVDAPPRLQQRGEEAALPKLGDVQLDVARLRAEQAWPGAVAVGRAGLAALVAGRADHPAGLELDELLGHMAVGLAGEIEAATGADRVEQLVQGRL